MIDRRLVIAQRSGFHFSWLNEEFKKHFREVIVTNDVSFPACREDVLFVNAHLGGFQNIGCGLKFGVLYPGFCFHPWKRPEQFDELKSIFSRYDGVFCHEGPVWESAKRDGTCPNFHLVPFCANTNGFKKTRKRDKFRRIIQVASPYEHKGRDISEAAMRLMPYEWELIPHKDQGFYVDYSILSDIYQNADGFLHPGRVGPAPGHFCDGKYTVSLIEAALSGCIIFWHDAMELGNSMKTVFEVSLDPKEIAEKIQEVVNGIDLETHSTKTAEEFREKHGVENTVKKMVDVISRFL